MFHSLPVQEQPEVKINCVSSEVKVIPVTILLRLIELKLDWILHIDGLDLIILNPSPKKLQHNLYINIYKCEKLTPQLNKYCISCMEICTFQGNTFEIWKISTRKVCDQLIATGWESFRSNILLQCLTWRMEIIFFYNHAQHKLAMMLVESLVNLHGWMQCLEMMPPLACHQGTATLCTF